MPQTTPKPSEALLGPRVKHVLAHLRWWNWFFVGPPLALAFLWLATGPAQGSPVLLLGGGAIDTFPAIRAPKAWRYIKDTRAHELPGSTAARLRQALTPPPKLLVFGADAKALREGGMTPELLLSWYAKRIDAIEAADVPAVYLALAPLPGDGPQVQAGSTRFNRAWEAQLCAQRVCIREDTPEAQAAALTQLLLSEGTELSAAPNRSPE